MLILDPGALMATQAMSPDHAYSAMPNAPLIPDPLPGSRRLAAVRRTAAAALESLADRVRPREQVSSCLPAAGH